MEYTNSYYNVVVSERAADMLVQHVRFVARVSMQAADKLRMDIVEAVKSLAVFPERNMRFTHTCVPEDKYRKMLVEKRYLIIYQIKESNVYVDYILDCRQDYRWLL
jgi:plasmid stabilization system protein ParE